MWHKKSRASHSHTNGVNPPLVVRITCCYWFLGDKNLQTQDYGYKGETEAKPTASLTCTQTLTVEIKLHTPLWGSLWDHRYWTVSWSVGRIHQVCVWLPSTRSLVGCLMKRDPRCRSTHPEEQDTTNPINTKETQQNIKEHIDISKTHIDMILSRYGHFLKWGFQ